MNLIRNLLRSVNVLVPKARNQILFMSSPDFSDNPKALFEYFMKHHKDMQLRWVVKSKEIAGSLNKSGINAVHEKSLRAILWLLRAGTLVTSHHSRAYVKSSRQLYVNLWHGVALKAIGYMDKDRSRIRRPSFNNENSITISTSRTVSTVFAGCFHTIVNQLIITGQPRNDDLFSPIPDSELSLLLDCDVSKYANIVFYMPTFRQGYLERTEGKSLEGANIFRFEKFNLESFREYLIQQNILFICKLHPFEEKLYKDVLGDLRKSIVLLSSEDLFKHNVNLYNVLGKADLLITDYSSVYFDYLLLDRPIVFTPTDLQEYENKRGFALDPYSFWTPGPKAVSQEELEIGLTRCLADSDYYHKERLTVNSIINYHKDARSSERVANEILKKLNRKK